MNEQEFKEAHLRAMTCVFIDSGRESTSLHRAVFDDASVCTPDFAQLIFQMMKWSGDETAVHIVLRPDPTYYFFHHFQKFPAVEFDTADSPTTYLSALNADPGGSPADAIGTNWWECVIVPPSINWFVHALRSSDDNGGHLWTPLAWKSRINESVYRGIGWWE